MRSPTPSPYRSQHPLPRPFPTRRIPGGWHDRWDGDPLDAVLAGLPPRDPNRRHMIEAGLDVELLAHARKDGRWEAHVASMRQSRASDTTPAVTADSPLVPWPSVNGPTALVALDALEAELREMIHDTLSEPPVSPIREMIGEA